MSTTIYVVTEGEYSAYRIAGVFDDQALAQRYVELRRRGSQFSDYLDIEEYDLNPFQEVVADNVKTWRVMYTHDGEEHLNSFLPSDNIEREAFKAFTPSSLRARDWAYYCTTTCETQEQAVKVCGERKAQFLAERAGIA